MKPINDQKTHTTIEETPSKNRDVKKKKKFVALRRVTSNIPALFTNPTSSQKHQLFFFMNIIIPCGVVHS